MFKILEPSNSHSDNRQAQTGSFKFSVVESFELENGSKTAKIDGTRYKCFAGAWCVYLPTLELKLLYAADGNLVCTHPIAPKSESVLSKTEDYGIYSYEEWKAALRKDVFERTAENYVAARLLWRAGLAPEPTRICFAKQTKWQDCLLSGHSAGIFVRNIKKMRKRTPVTSKEFTAAGLVPDKLGSSLREQIRGYVSDLNSVVGTRPVSHHDEISKITAFLRQASELPVNF